jgi:hypothetical protein
MAAVLKGVRVVDHSTFITGAAVGQLLGDLGANVIKVERPGEGDPFRAYKGSLSMRRISRHSIATSEASRLIPGTRKTCACLMRWSKMPTSTSRISDRARRTSSMQGNNGCVASTENWSIAASADSAQPGRTRTGQYTTRWRRQHQDFSASW